MKTNYLYLLFLLAFVLTPALSYGEEAVAKAEGIACPQDSKLCPNGTFVGRNGSNCEFAKCAGEEDEQRNGAVPTLYDDEDSAENEDMDDSDSSDDSDEMNDDSDTSTDDVDDNEDGDDESDDNEVNKRGEERRSRVANAVQEMLRVASSTNETIGEQIRTMAQEQNQIHQDAEDVVEKIAKRGGFARFFVGPDYSEIKKAEKYAEQYNERLQKMGEVAVEVTAEDLVTAIEAQIQNLTQVKTELEAEIQAQKGGFSLFGWLNRLLAQ